MKDKKIKKINTKPSYIYVLLIIFVLVVGITLAYFVATVQGNDKAKENTLVTGTAELELDGTTIVDMGTIYPGDSKSVNFSVTNTGTIDTVYNLDMINVVNTFVDTSDLVYTITSTNSGGTKEQTEAPVDSGTLISDIPIAKGVTHFYTMTFTFLETNDNQDDNAKARFRGKIQVNNTMDKSLAKTILKDNPLNLVALTEENFSAGEPTYVENLNGYTYTEQVENNITDLRFTTDVGYRVASDYSFDESTGIYTLKNSSTISTITSAYTGYFICDSQNSSSCAVLFQINNISNNEITNANMHYSIGSYKNGLFSIMDENGTSYYFRGEVNNNYVSFAGYTWRIVRINGDGTVRLILNESTGEKIQYNPTREAKMVGYTYDNESNCTKSSPCISSYDSNTKKFINNKTVTNSTIKEYLENTWYQQIADYDDYIAQGSFCNDTSISSYCTASGMTCYNSGLRFGNPTLECQDTSQNFGGYYESKIGILSGDETFISGFDYMQTSSSVLIDYAKYVPNSNYLSVANTWTMSPEYVVENPTIHVIDDYPVLGVLSPDDEGDVRPVINLKADVNVTSGDGTASNPYVIETN